MELVSNFKDVLESIKINKPMVHHITNYVTANDCANIVLALGGSPVMAEDPREVEEVVSLSSALVLNTGTLNHFKIDSFILAGKKANSLGIPVILDPVGVGATKLRTQVVSRILEEVRISVLRGNMSEIKHIYGAGGITRGVDSTDNSRDGGKEVALSLANRLKAVVAITGELDIVSDGNKVYCIENGHRMLSRVTGTGCMTSSLIGLCCGGGAEPLKGAIFGIMIMGLSGERAYGTLEKKDQVGSFRVNLIDAIGSFTIGDIIEGGRVYEG